MCKFLLLIINYNKCLMIHIKPYSMWAYNNYVSARQISFILWRFVWFWKCENFNFLIFDKMIDTKMSEGTDKNGTYRNKFHIILYKKCNFKTRPFLPPRLNLVEFSTFMELKLFFALAYFMHVIISLYL